MVPSLPIRLLNALLYLQLKSRLTSILAIQYAVGLGTIRYVAYQGGSYVRMVHKMENDRMPQPYT